MDILIDSVHYNITVEDLEDAAIEFSFWRGRRFCLRGKDTEMHSLRFNDIIAGVLAEDAIFEKNEDRQNIFATLDRLKGQEYPYTGSCVMRVVLWVKQFFGNISREELLNQLRGKLCVEGEEESLTEDESDAQALTSPIYDSHPNDLLPLMLQSAGKSACLPLMSTCKLFYEIISSDKSRWSYFRDFKLLKQIFNTHNSKFLFDPIKESCLPLLAEFDSKEMTNKIRELMSTSDFDLKAAKADLQGISMYTDHLAKIGTALARINPKGALRIAALIDKKKYPVDYFCVLAAVAKNSTLCDRKAVIEIGKQIALLSCLNSHCSLLFEAFIGLDNSRALEMVELIRSHWFISFYFRIIAEVIQKINPVEIEVYNAVVNLIDDFLQLNYFTPNLSDIDDELASENLILVAKSFSMFDREKAIKALNLALSLVEAKKCIGCLEWEKHLRLSTDRVIAFLADIAEIFAEFDKQRATEVLNQALKGIKICFVPLLPRYPDEKYYLEYRDTLLDLLHKIIKIVATIDISQANPELEKYADKMRAIERSFLGNNNPLEEFPYQLFMGAVDIFAPFDREKASKMANSSLEWAKTLSPSKESDRILVKLSHALLKNFPDQAIAVANVINTPHVKCQALHSIISQGSAYPKLTK